MSLLRKINHILGIIVFFNFLLKFITILIKYLLVKWVLTKHGEYVNVMLINMTKRGGFPYGRRL